MAFIALLSFSQLCLLMRLGKTHPFLYRWNVFFFVAFRSIALTFERLLLEMVLVDLVVNFSVCFDAIHLYIKAKLAKLT